MSKPTDRLAASSSRFKAFFEELSESFIERDDLLKQIAIALLSREHVLITGPPGTAKSRLAWAVLGRIVDESSGLPSLFARQFTESTVQTDLVGPIDFKTLMDTGRTEHFTDQGMLGAVHSFLDEVFDGRDMLLRSTLNILNERELKQGTTITRGQIECAIMTSNRYLAEVLDGSREALLAFADRVAHIAFVPKGFGDAVSLRRLLRVELSGSKAQPLSTRLTIQDLDALQRAVEDLEIAPELCDLLAELARDFESELGAACRADPGFVPTRYLSTRTVVRLGKTLRAAAVYDHALGGRKRALAVGRHDFAALRLSLLLCGPTPEQVSQLLATEPDPRERRQLEILRVERELFERCLARLPDVQVPPKAEPSAGEPTLPEPLAPVSAEASLETRVEPPFEVARSRAIHAALEACSALETGPFEVALKLSAMAVELETADPANRPVARWLRSEGLRRTRQALLLAPTEAGENLLQWLAGTPTPTQATQRSEARIERINALLQLEVELLAGGGSHEIPAQLDEQRGVALQRLESDLIALWEGVLIQQLQITLGNVPSDELSKIFKALGPILQAVRALDAQLAAARQGQSSLMVGVFGRRLSPLLKASCDRFDASDRARAVEQVGELLETLKRFELTQAVQKPELLADFTRALLRAEPKIPSDCAHDLKGYGELRRHSERRSLAYTLAQISLRLSEALSSDAAEDVIALVRGTLELLPDDLAQEVVDKDLSRVSAALGLLEAWWQDLSKVTGRPDQALQRIAKSRFLHITRDEGTLPRFALEIELLAQLLPRPELAIVSARISDLERRSSETLSQLLSQSSEQRWQELLSAPHP